MVSVQGFASAFGGAFHTQFRRYSTNRSGSSLSSQACLWWQCLQPLAPLSSYSYGIVTLGCESVFLPISTHWRPCWTYHLPQPVTGGAQEKGNLDTLQVSCCKTQIVSVPCSPLAAWFFLTFHSSNTEKSGNKTYRNICRYISLYQFP